MTIEHKTIPFELTSVDAVGRTIEGYAAVFGNVDQGGDIIHRGAFKKTLAERGGKVRLLWQHDTYEPIGRPVEMREDDRGLYVKAVISDTQRGRDALALLRDDAIDGLSIGYETLDSDYTTSSDGNGEKMPMRNLRTIKLYEFSLVTFPMNEEAAVTALKGNPGTAEPEQPAQREVKTVSQAIADLFAALAAAGHDLTQYISAADAVGSDNGTPSDGDGAPHNEAAPDGDNSEGEDEHGQAGSEDDESQAGPDAKLPDGADGAPPTSTADANNGNADSERLRLLAQIGQAQAELGLMEVDHA